MKVYTLKELASEMGVPWQTVAAMKRKGQLPPKAAKSDGTFVKSIIDPFIEEFKNNSGATEPEEQPQAPAPPKQSPKPAPAISYDDFVRGYWQQGSRAVDVLLMTPEIGPKIADYVNEALRYAYETLGSPTQR